MKAGKLDEAERLYELARDDPVHTKWIAGLARVHLRQENDAKFLTDLAMIADNDADDLDVRKALAQRHLAAKQPEQAEKWAMECLYVDVYDPSGHIFLADALSGQKKYAPAIEEYQTAIDLKAKRPNDLKSPARQGPARPRRPRRSQGDARRSAQGRSRPPRSERTAEGNRRLNRGGLPGSARFVRLPLGSSTSGGRSTAGVPPAFLGDGIGSRPRQDRISSGLAHFLGRTTSLGVLRNEAGEMPAVPRGGSTLPAQFERSPDPGGGHGFSGRPRPEAGSVRPRSNSPRPPAERSRSSRPRSPGSLRRRARPVAPTQHLGGTRSWPSRSELRYFDQQRRDREGASCEAGKSRSRPSDGSMTDRAALREELSELISRPRRPGSRGPDPRV